MDRTVLLRARLSNEAHLAEASVPDNLVVGVSGILEHLARLPDMPLLTTELEDISETERVVHWPQLFPHDSRPVRNLASRYDYGRTTLHGAEPSIDAIARAVDTMAVEVKLSVEARTTSTRQGSTSLHELKQGQTASKGGTTEPAPALSGKGRGSGNKTPSPRQRGRE